MQDERGVFDRFAAKVARFVSRAPFFCFCVLMVLMWFPSYFMVKKVDTWQLIINTTTTIVTFLLVAVSQNAAARAEQATNRKTDAIADALADFIEFYADHTQSDQDKAHLLRDARDLRDTVGVQERTGA